MDVSIMGVDNGEILDQCGEEGCMGVDVLL